MLVKEVRVLEEAVIDLEQGKQFYDNQEIGVGNYFWDSLIADIESLQIYAGVHIKQFSLHRMYAKRFPYAIYYYTENAVAFVVAVLPMRRKPELIRQTVQRRR